MPHGLDIDQLRTFLAIAELGSFTKAAEAVHKTQSAVSMQMRRLEERLERPIFVKDGRNSRLTEDGHRLIEYAQRMIRLNDETLLAFSEPTMVGMVRLGLPDDYAERLLPQVLAAFARLNPAIEIAVQCQGSIFTGQMIARGDLDIAIVTSGDCVGFQGDVIRREQLHWVAPANRCIHTEEPVRLALGPTTCSWRTQAVSLLDRLNRRYCVAYSSSSAAALISAVQAGLAIAVLPESAVRSGMRILGENDGFPALPHCDITMLRAATATDPVHDALCAHIQAAIGNVSMNMAAA
ncbi:LysR family transcriptional regulator [Stappia taiwanensis]|uniref:LysR family transcriptional regulator n=1 Tax=Stappia taiwanensis TaxID=992267 RepID=A0A838XUA7_9HYPH|nr:LysR substrate-binding domain-containing protein [Stappia taiwanensis]MBA4612096.1 LysR family transcriptional regulator [Stappia taiwanensis]GGE91125.1 LysR family transcriptional regulator [Stappia taiwanensis]